MSSPLVSGGDYWDTIEAALTSLPETNRLREPALASFDHLKDRVTNSNHMALVAVARAAEHLVAYDDAVKEWDAIDALADPRAKQEASDRAHELLTRAIDGAREALARLDKDTAA